MNKLTPNPLFLPCENLKVKPKENLSIKEKILMMKKTFLKIKKSNQKESILLIPKKSVK
jgi:hypothetical protein